MSGILVTYLRCLTMIPPSYLCFAMLQLLLAACKPTSTDLMPGPEADPAKVIADFRTLEGQSAAAVLTPEFKRQIINSVVGQNAPDDYMVNDRLGGAFTEPGREQVIYLLVRGGPDASRPQPRPPLLALYEGDRFITQFVPKGAGYRRFAGSVDVDGDGVMEVLLQAESLQMGAFIRSVDLFGFRGGKRQLLQRFQGVYEDSCDTPMTTGGIRATVLMLAPAESGNRAKIRRREYAAACPDNSTSAVDIEFKPLSHQ
jgi:hypothetical protein